MTELCATAVYQMAFQNAAGGGLDGFMIQFNSNALGVAPASQHLQIQLGPGGNATTAVPLTRNQAMVNPAAGRALQVGLNPPASPRTSSGF